MHYSGAVYRPPSEARSLIVQCTLGCSHNKCAFCTMYKDKKFSINPIEQVLSDLDEARAYGRYIEKIFLADGDALILPMDYLLTVLDYICDHFPTCKRVAAYATTKAIMRKTDDELRTLREHGLGKDRRHAEECRHPEPEERARAARDERRGGACDVACADLRGNGRGKRLEGAHAALVGTLAEERGAAEEVARRKAEFSYLHEAQPEGVEKARAAQQRDEEEHAPKDAVDVAH